MEAIIITLLIVLVGFAFLTWTGTRSKNQPADNGLQQKVDSLQKTMDESLVRIMFLESHAKETSDRLREASAKKEEKDVYRKPLTAESVRTALRYNGFSPEIVDTHLDDWQAVRFKVEETFFRIDTSRLPLLTLETGFRMDKDEDVELMERAAREVTAGIFVGKAKVLRGEEESAVVFQAEFIAVSYLYFRDSFKEYLNIVIETHKRFYETYENLKEEKKKELDQVDRVINQVRSGTESKKVMS